MNHENSDRIVAALERIADTLEDMNDNGGTTHRMLEARLIAIQKCLDIVGGEIANATAEK